MLQLILQHKSVKLSSTIIIPLVSYSSTVSMPVDIKWMTDIAKIQKGNISNAYLYNHIDDMLKKSLNE